MSKRRWLGRTVLGALLLLAATPAGADEAKTADIRTLMEITKVESTYDQMFALSLQQQLQFLQKARPDIPRERLERYQVLFHEEQTATKSQLTDSLVAIYDRYFSHDDIKELIAFNRSPIGQKTLAIMPQLIQESAVAGQRWGQTLSERVRARFSAESQ